MELGTVKWFNTKKGFGLIAPSGGGEDVFVDQSVLGAESLYEGQPVEFERQLARTGPRARSVRPRA